MDHREDRRSAEERVRPAAAPVRRSRVAIACWVFVLLAIGIVQIVRLQWFDAVVFLFAAIGVVLMALEVLPRPRVWHLILPWLAGGAGALAAVLCFLPRHSPAMQAAVIAIGAASVVLAWSGAAVADSERLTALTRGIRRLALAWAVIVVAGCVWELIQFILGLVEPDATWFALSDLLNPIVETVPGQVVLIAAWLAGGVWLLRRGGRR